MNIVRARIYLKTAFSFHVHNSYCEKCAFCVSDRQTEGQAAGEGLDGGEWGSWGKCGPSKQTSSPQINASNRKWSTSGLPAGGVRGEETHSLFLTQVSHWYLWHTHTHTRASAGKHTTSRYPPSWYLCAVSGSERPWLKLAAACELKLMLCLIKVIGSAPWLSMTDTRFHDTTLWGYKPWIKDFIYINCFLLSQIKKSQPA